MGTYFASKAKAMMPATMGAETEVPVWPSVQRCRRSVVTWVTGQQEVKLALTRCQKLLKTLHLDTCGPRSQGRKRHAADYLHTQGRVCSSLLVCFALIHRTATCRRSERITGWGREIRWREDTQQEATEPHCGRRRAVTQR